MEEAETTTVAGRLELVKKVAVHQGNHYGFATCLVSLPAAECRENSRSFPTTDSMADTTTPIERRDGGFFVVVLMSLSIGC